MFSPLFKINFFLKLFTIFKLPLLAYARPKVVELSSKRSVIRVPLGYRTKNHLNVMYFGALAMGGELTIAIKAVDAIHRSGQKIDFIFKDFRANFVKRADADVHFICEEADLVESLIEEAKTNPARLEKTYKAYAICPSRGPDHVAEFELTLSVRNRSLAKSSP